MQEKTEKKSISGEKVLKNLENILKLSTKYGVTEIKYGDIHVIFGEGTQAPARKPNPAMFRKQQTTEQLSALKNEMDQVSDEIAVSHIEDPLAYEDAIVEGLLTDERPRDEETNRINN